MATTFLVFLTSDNSQEVFTDRLFENSSGQVNFFLVMFTQNFEQLYLVQDFKSKL